MSQFSCLVNKEDDNNKFSSFPNTDAYLSGVIDGILAASEQTSDKIYNVMTTPSTRNYASTKQTEFFTEHMSETTMAPTTMPPTTMPFSAPTMAPTTMPFSAPTMAPTTMPFSAPTMATTMPFSAPTTMPFSAPTTMSFSAPTTMSFSEPLPTTIPVIKPTSPHEMKIVPLASRTDTDVAPFPTSYIISIVILFILIIGLLTFMYIPKKV